MFLKVGSTKFSQNWRKLGLKKEYFPKNMSGFFRAEEELEMVSLRS